MLMFQMVCILLLQEVCFFTLESKGIPKEIISHLKFVDGYVGNFSGRNEDYGLSQYRHYGAIVTYKDDIVTTNPSSGYVAVMGSAGGSSLV